MLHSNSGKNKGGSESGSQSKSESEYNHNHAYTYKYSLLDLPSICYRLSDPRFIENGWTILPQSKSMMRFITYQAEAANPYFSWFIPRFQAEEKQYENGKIFSRFHSNGAAEVFYPNGQLALALTQEENEMCRVTVLSSGGNNKRGIYRKPVVLAIFDSFGNGIIYNEHGTVRLKYTQKYGILYDTPSGLPVKWRWAVALEIDHLTRIIEENNHMEKVKQATMAHVHAVFASKDAKDTVKSPTIKDVRSKDPIPVPVRDTNEMNPSNTIDSNNSSGKQKKDNLAVYKTVPRKNGTSDLSQDVNINKTDLKVTNKSSSKKKHPKDIEDIVTPVKFIVLKMNHFFAFRLLDQNNINLKFNTLHKFLRLELGVRVNPVEEARVDMVDDTTKHEKK